MFGWPSQSSLALSPNLPAMRKLIARKRILLHSAPANPADLEHLVLPESYTLYVPQLGVEENSSWEILAKAIVECYYLAEKAGCDI